MILIGMSGVSVCIPPPVFPSFPLQVLSMHKTRSTTHVGENPHDFTSFVSFPFLSYFLCPVCRSQRSSASSYSHASSVASLMGGGSSLASQRSSIMSTSSRSSLSSGLPRCPPSGSSGMSDGFSSSSRGDEVRDRMGVSSAVRLAREAVDEGQGSGIAATSHCRRRRMLW